MRTMLPALVLATALGACGGAPEQETDPMSDDLEGTAWVLRELPGRELTGRQALTLRFSDGRLGGSDGCNRYTGAYRRAGAALRLEGPLAGTLMACAPPLMEQAAAFREALERTRSAQTDAAGLRLLDAGGDLVARFTAQDETLAGSRWTVTGYNNGRGGVQSVLGGTQLVLEFGEDGRLSGSAGCNRLTASFEQNGSTLRLGPVAGTKRLCPEPEGIMEQEAAFLAALSGALELRLEGDALELRAPDGALQISAERE